MPIKALIFDMDGVICDTNPTHCIAFHKFFQKRGINPTQEEYKTHMYGKPNSYILSHFLGRPIEGQELLDMEDEKESLFRTLYAEKVEPISGYLSFLQVARVLRLAIGIATSAPRANLDLIAGKLGLYEIAQSHLASEDVTAHKPDPEIYLKSAENLQVIPDECVVFEDSYSGISAALNAGMKVIGVLSSHRKEELPPCNFYIESYSKSLIKDVLKLGF